MPKSTFPEEPKWPMWKILAVSFTIIVLIVSAVRAFAGATIVKTIWAMIP